MPRTALRTEFDGFQVEARDSTYPSFKAALAHVAPVFLDRDATVDKCRALIAQAARNGARLVVFPEAYIPAFPAWAALDAPINNHEFFTRLAANSVRVPGPEVSSIAEAARRAGIFVSVGVNEGTDVSVGCIWNSNLLIGEDGAVLNHHRKIVPTFFEKLVWGERRRSRTSRRRYPHRSHRGIDLRGEHESAGSLCADGPGRAGARLELPSGLAHPGSGPRRQLRSGECHSHPRRGSFLRGEVLYPGGVGIHGRAHAPGAGKDRQGCGANPGSHPAAASPW